MKYFDFRTAMLKLDGQSFSVRDLEKALARIRIESKGYLPADVGARELLDLAHERGYLVELPTGKLQVMVPEDIDQVQNERDSALALEAEAEADWVNKVDELEKANARVIQLETAIITFVTEIHLFNIHKNHQALCDLNKILYPLTSSSLPGDEP